MRNQQSGLPLSKLWDLAKESLRILHSHMDARRCGDAAAQIRVTSRPAIVIIIIIIIIIITTTTTSSAAVPLL